jgi:hypothetical protein
MFCGRNNMASNDQWEKLIKIIVRLIIFLCFLGTSLWSSQQAFELNSAGFGWLAFISFCAAAFSAISIFEKT